MESLGTPRRPAKDIKAMLAAAGYGGEPLVNLHVSDHPTYDAISQVVVRRLREVGLTVRDEIMDHNTFYKRRYSKEPLDKGGWSTWSTGTSALLYFSDPVMSGVMRGNGAGSLPLNPKLEESRTRWMELADEAGRNAICRDHQAEMLRSVHIVPLGQYSYYSAWRNNVSGVRRSPLPLFWGISKS